MQLYRYFVSQSSDFCRHNPLCCFSTSVYYCKRIFRYRLSPETFGYTLVPYNKWHPFVFTNHIQPRVWWCVTCAVEKVSLSRRGNTTHFCFPERIFSSSVAYVSAETHLGSLSHSADVGSLQRPTCGPLTVFSTRPTQVSPSLKYL
jgi:hypothetical protein